MTDNKSIPGLSFPDSDGFRQITERLKIATDTKNDRAMFEALGLKARSVHAAVKKQQVQPGWIIEALIRFGASSRWLIFGNEDLEVRKLPINLPKIKNNKIDLAQTAGELAFTREWLETKGNIEDLILMRAVGDSMEPIIRDKALILINQALDQPYPGAIFALAYNGNIKLHRLHTEPGTFILRSDNQRYSEVKIEAVQGELPKDIKIIGRVVCWWHEEIL